MGKGTGAGDDRFFVKDNPTRGVISYDVDDPHLRQVQTRIEPFHHYGAISTGV